MKIVVLSMTSESHLLYKLESDLIENTWGGMILSNKYLDVYYYTIKSGNKNKIHKHTVYCNCSDGIDGTFDKLRIALRLIRNEIDFDVVVKTNTNTFLNIRNIVRFLNQIKFDRNSNLCIGNIFNLRNSESKEIIYKGSIGYFMLMSRLQCDVLADEYRTYKELELYKNTYLLNVDDILAYRVIDEHLGNPNELELKLYCYKCKVHDLDQSRLIEFNNPHQVNDALYVRTKIDNDLNNRMSELDHLMELYQALD